MSAGFMPSAPYGDVGSSDLFLPVGGGGGPVAPPVQPGFLSAAQLGSLQSTLLLSLPWLATVLKNTPTLDAAGDQAESWAAIAIYNCDVELMMDVEEAPVAGQEQSIGSYLITLPWNAVIQAENRIQVNGVTYEVVNRFTNWTDQAAVFVSADEVK